MDCMFPYLALRQGLHNSWISTERFVNLQEHESMGDLWGAAVSPWLPDLPRRLPWLSFSLLLGSVEVRGLPSLRHRGGYKTALQYGGTGSSATVFHHFCCSHLTSLVLVSSRVRDTETCHIWLLVFSLSMKAINWLFKACFLHCLNLSGWLCAVLHNARTLDLSRQFTK